MKNQEIARLFSEMADILEIKGDNPFKIRAYRRAALNIEGLTRNVEDLTRDELMEIPGIGKELAAKIEEYVTTGSMHAHEKLKEETDCSQYPPEELLRGIAEFNARAWFDCHETLEDLWTGEPGLVRDLYQGILQVAVGLHHWRDGNYQGATLLFRKGAQLLRHVAPVCQQVEAAILTRDVERFRARLEALGPERMAELEEGLIPRIRLRGKSTQEL